MTKEDLLKFAGEKNFTSKFIYSRPYKYIACEKREKTRYNLWMSELQEWLRDNHKIHVTVTSISQESWQYHITKPGQKLGENYNEDFYDYEEALSNGLFDSIKLL